MIPLVDVGRTFFQKNTPSGSEFSSLVRSVHDTQTYINDHFNELKQVIQDGKAITDEAKSLIEDLKRIRSEYKKETTPPKTSKM